MKKNNLLLATIVLAASSMVVTACTKKKGSGVDPDIPVVNPVTIKDLEKALAKDYSNCTVGTVSKYIESEGDLDISEYDSIIYYYDGYAILYDELAQESGYPNPYLYYHDYEGVNRLYFDGNESAGERDGWLAYTASGYEYALRHTEFYLPDFLTGLDLTKVIPAGGNFYITDPTEVERLNYTVFGGVLTNDIQEVVIILDDDGYVNKIYGFEEEDNDKEYFVADIFNIGKTLFDESKLPPKPNAENCIEFWQYKGWDGPEKRIYPSGATIQANDVADRVNPKTMEIDDYFRVDYELEWPAKEGQFHFVERSDVSWKTTNPNVAKVASKTYKEQRKDTFGNPIFELRNGTDTIWVAKDSEGVYHRSGTNKPEYVVVVADETALIPVMEDVWHNVIVATGAGEADIYLVCRSESDDQKVHASAQEGVESNRLHINVKDVADINKENAVYDLTFVNVTDDNKVIVTNKNTEHAAYPVDVTGHHVIMGDCKNSNLFYSKVAGEQKLYMDSQEGQGGEAYLNFDFDDQQVSSLDFYYGYWMLNDKNGKKPTNIEVRTSNDGENWNTIDITEEIVNNISGEHKKLCSVEFEPATKVQLYMYSNMIGGTYHFKLTLDDTVFSANSACHMHNASGEVAVESITLTGLNQLRVGDETTLTAAVSPADATNKTVTWASSDETVATVDENGKVTALAVGTANITATAANGVVSNAIAMTVSAPITIDAKYAGIYSSDLELDNPQYYAVVDNHTNQMTFKVYDYSTTLDLDDFDGSRTYTFRNDANEKIVANFAGDANSFFASTGNKSYINGRYLEGNVELQRVINVTGIKLNVSGASVNADGEYDILPGKSAVVTAAFTPSNANRGTDLTWTTSNTNGRFDEEYHSFKANTSGKVTLTATSDEFNDVTASVTFNILTVANVTNITISGAPEGGKTFIQREIVLTANITPATANDFDLVWSSSDTDAATTHKLSATTCRVTTKNLTGTVVITVRDTKSGVVGTVTLDIQNATGAVTFDPSLAVEDATDGACLYMTITEDGEMTILDIQTDTVVVLTFTGEFGQIINSKVSYRFSNEDGTLVIDAAKYSKDEIDLVEVTGSLAGLGLTITGDLEFSF